MKQAKRSFLVLLACGAVGLIVAVLAWQGTGEDLAKSAPEASALLTFDERAVEAIELTKEQSWSRVDRGMHGWCIREPVALAADEDQVQRLLSAVLRLRPEIVYGVEGAPAAPDDDVMGLIQPAQTVILTLGGTPSRVLRIDIGARSEFNRDVYARTWVDGQVRATVMISASRAKSLDLSWQDLQDRRLFGASAVRVGQIRVIPKVTSPVAVPFTVKRVPPAPDQPRHQREDRFLLLEPGSGDADLATVDAVFTSLTRAPFQDFPTMDHGGFLGPWGLDAPAFVVEVTLASLWARDEKGAPATMVRTFSLSEPRDGKVYVGVSDEPWVAEVDPVILTGLALSKTALESKRLLFLAREDVARLELDLKDVGNLVLEKEPGVDGRWRMLAPEPAIAKAHLVTGLILVFGGLVGTARELVGPEARDPKVRARYGLGPDAQRIRFLNMTGETIATVLLGKVKGDDLYVTIDEGEMIVRVSKGKLDELPLSASELIDAR